MSFEGRGASRRRAPVRRDSRGAAAVEFALILPVLMLIVFGIINFGDVLSTRQSVSQAASEGARAAAVAQSAPKAAAESKRDIALMTQGQTCNSRCGVVVTDCADAPPSGPNDPKNVLPAENNSGADDDDCVWVRVSIDVDPLVPGYSWMLPDTLTYTAVATVS